jgi:hypothetical protein
VQAEEFTVPLPPHPKPAGRHVPSAKLEPGMGEDKTLLNAQPRPFVPVFTFDPDPALAQQGILSAGATPASGPPAQAAGPAQGRKRVRVFAMAGLFAAVVGIAVGVKLLPSTPSTPITSAPSTPASPAPSPAAATPSTAIPDSETAPVAADNAGEHMPDSRAQAKERPDTSKSAAATTRKDQATRQSATAARGDLCRSAVVSERPASCLFKKQ